MNEMNKKNLVQFGKVALVALICMVAIITSAGVWNGNANGCVDAFYGWVAGLNLVSTGFGVWALARKFWPKENK